ncbi:hypothetical protein EDB86DRAFT_2825166 [Lactarius hatsudake]|nr:hypothetical protein EDB86DRAFT_2825166 [Lactarius hatsudake]
MSAVCICFCAPVDAAASQTVVDMVLGLNHVSVGPATIDQGRQVDSTLDYITSSGLGYKLAPMPDSDIVWWSLGCGADVREQSSRCKAAHGGGNFPTRFSQSLLTKRPAIVATTYLIARAGRATAARFWGVRGTDRISYPLLPFRATHSAGPFILRSAPRTVLLDALSRDGVFLSSPSTCHWNPGTILSYILVLYGRDPPTRTPRRDGGASSKYGSTHIGLTQSRGFSELLPSKIPPAPLVMIKWRYLRDIDRARIPSSMMHAATALVR